MRRIFIDGPLGESMTVSGELVRHIGLSLRMAVGDRLGVADVDGRKSSVFQLKRSDCD